MDRGESKPAFKKNNFDTLRLFFAVLVVFSHSYPLLRGTNVTEPLSRLTHGVVNFGELSVWAFFVISGFLITGSWQRSPHWGRFLKRRVSRIYPGFIAATMLCAVVVAPIATRSSLHEHVSLWNYLSHVLRLQMFVEGHPFDRNPIPGVMNGSLWSIPFEFWCYIGVAFLGLTALLRRRMLIVFVLWFVMGGHLVIEAFHLSPGGKILGKIFGYPVFWFTVLPFFLSGMLLQLFGEKVKLRTDYALAATVLLAASTFVPHATVFTAPLFGSYVILWLAYLPVLHSLNLGRWGDFSYGTYLYAFPIQQLLTYRFSAELTPLSLFLLAAPLSVAAGIISWHAVEKHFMPRTMIRRLEERPAKGSSVALTKSGAAFPQEKATL